MLQVAAQRKAQGIESLQGRESFAKGTRNHVRERGRERPIVNIGLLAELSAKASRKVCLAQCAPRMENCGVRKSLAKGRERVREGRHGMWRRGTQVLTLLMKKREP